MIWIKMIILAVIYGLLWRICGFECSAFAMLIYIVAHCKED